MSNRNLSNRLFSATRDRKYVDAKVAFGATGAPTLDATKSNGVISVTRDAAGKFTFLFGTTANGRNVLDAYNRLLGVRAVFDTSGVSAGAQPASPSVSVIDNQITDPTKGYVQVMLSKLDTPAATDPANGEVGYFEFTFGDGS